MLHIVLMSEKFLLHFGLDAKPDAKLQTQRYNKVRIPYRYKLITLLDDLQKKTLKYSKLVQNLMRNQKKKLFFLIH